MNRILKENPDLHISNIERISLLGRALLDWCLVLDEYADIVNNEWAEDNLRLERLEIEMSNIEKALKAGRKFRLNS